MGVVIFAIDARLCHSFHEIELLDIPNILFPSQRGKLYQVIGIGMQEKFRNFYVIIKGQHGSITYRLPEELLTWVPVCFHVLASFHISKVAASRILVNCVS